MFVGGQERVQCQTGFNGWEMWFRSRRSFITLNVVLPFALSEEFERVSFISHNKKVYEGLSQKRLPDDNDTLCLILQRTNSARLYFIIVY